MAKMNNIRLTVMAAAALVAALGVSSCSLREDPYGFYSGDNFYTTEADARSALLYMYDAITYIEYSRNIVFIGDMNTDEIHPKGDATASNKDLDGWRLNNLKTNTSLGNFFKYSYITINRANAIIANVPKMSMDQKLKDQYVGEATFMRAYSYFNLARNFGRVPIHTEPVTSLDQTAASLPASLDEMWKLIISDLESACSLLDYFDKPLTGRADLAAAQGLLAKAYIYLASAKEHGTPFYKDMALDVDDYYRKAGEWAAKVVANPEQKTYGFDPDLLHIYDVQYPDGPEHLFIMSMDRSGKEEGQFSKISKMYIPYIAGGTVYLRNQSSSALEPTHDGFSEYQTSIAFYDSFESGDLRRDWLIVSEVYDADGNVVAVYPGKLSYPFCRKYIDPFFENEKTSTKPYLMRYSDILLVYAEAVGNTPEGYAAVNKVRERAGLEPLPAGLNIADFRNRVIQERKYELAFEGNICYDLRRTNSIHTQVTTAREQALSAEDVVFYPIPSIETDLNPNIR